MVHQAVKHISFTTVRGCEAYKTMLAEMEDDLENLKKCFLKEGVSTPDAFITLSQRRSEWMAQALETAQRVDASERMLASSVAIEAHVASKDQS